MYKLCLVTEVSYKRRVSMVTLLLNWNRDKREKAISLKHGVKTAGWDLDHTFHEQP